MKFSLAFLIALALSGAVKIQASPIKSSSELNDILDEFLALVPQEKVVEIFLDYLANDSEVQAVVEYVQTGEFKELVKKVDSIDDVINFYDYLDKAGLNIYESVNALHEVIGLPPLVPGKQARNVRITGGFAGLIEDIKATLPLDDIKALYDEKLETSPAFAQLIEHFRSPKFQELIDALRANEEFQKIVKFCREAGVDIAAIKDLLMTLLGLEFPDIRSNPLLRLTRADLNDDLQDFLELLPVDEIEEIAMDYYLNDPEIKLTVEYLQSEPFKQILVEVEAMKEARDVLAFLQESGLDVNGFLNSIHELLEIPAFKPSFRAVSHVSRATGGLTGLIADIKAILPIEDIKALHYKKLEDSPAFIRLIERLSSPQFQEFIDAVLIKEEARVIINKLKSHGVDVQAFADFLATILGLKFPKPVMARANEELISDLVDFMNLMPLQDVIDISIDYLMNDVEFQKAVGYIITDEFKVLATDAEQNDEFRSFLGYLDESGLPASEYINRVNELLEIPEVVSSLGLRESRRTGTGVRGLLDDIEDLIPTRSVKKMYDDKMKNSKAFIFFIERLHAPEFQAIVDRLVQNKAFQKLGYRAAEFGIDLEAIVEFFSRVLGIEIPSDLLPARLARTLENDLQEFLDLLPKDKIRKIVVRHYLFDKEFKRAYTYIMSEEFHQLIENLNEISEYNDLLKAFEEAGLDVQGLILQIHELIGFQNVRSSDDLWKARGIASFVSEVKAVLPLNDIRALYEKKIETSKDFVQFVEVISSEQFQAVTDALFDDDIFTSILHQLQDYGIDLNVVSDFFLTVFGIKTPPGVIE